jgi:hypothetical protein
MIKKERHIVIEWGDVKKRFLSVVADGQEWPRNLPNHRHSRAYHMQNGHRNLIAPPKPKGCPTGLGHKQHLCAYCRWDSQFGSKAWEGGSYFDTVTYLRNGYFAKEFAHSAEYVALAPKKRPQWSEEPDGDLDMGRLYGGYEDPYMVPAEAEKKPGLRVMIEFAFACGVNAKTIEKYGAWVAGLLGSLESSGYDLTVDLWIPLDNLFVDSHGRRDNVLIRVKRENEVSDFTEWSGIFSPAGYRHVGFCAKLVAGDKVGSLAEGSLGTTIGGRTWGLDYDKDNSILKIHCDQRGSRMYGGDSFPTEALNRKAQEIGLLPKEAKLEGRV